MKLKAILFDIDGTVYSNNWMTLYTIPLFLRDPMFLIRFKKVRELLHSHPEVVDASGLSLEEFQAHRLAQLTGKGATPMQCKEQIDSFRLRWEGIFSKIKPYQHFKDTVLHLKATGLKVGLFSDFPISDKMQRLGIDNMWDVELSAQDCGALKPDVRGFLRAAELIGFSPEHILYVGNSYRFDVLGSKAAGMISAHLHYGKAPAGSVADITFYDYSVLERWVMAYL